MKNQFNYDMVSDEFIENLTGVEEGDITGNRVFITFSHGQSPRYKIEIDDFGCVISALNRLVKKIQPNFIFPRNF